VGDIRFDDASDLELLLFRQDGVLTFAQARQFFSEAAIRHRVQAGRWQRPHRGVIVANSGSVTGGQRTWIAVLTCGPNAVLSGVSSLTPTRGNPIHVLVHADHEPRNPPGGVIVHRTSILPDAHVHRLTYPPRTRPGRAVVDAASWAGTTDAARLAIADAFQRRLVTLDEIVAVLAILPRTSQRRLIAQTARDCAGGSHSLAELGYLRHSRRAGLPEPTRQLLRKDSRGHSRYLDVVYEPWGVHVEIDGAQHTDAKA
jgi:hypothetical protein